MRLPFFKEFKESNYVVQVVVGIVVAFLLLFIFAKFLLGVAIGIVVGIPLGAYLLDMDMKKRASKGIITVERTVDVTKQEQELTKEENK